jgi:peptidoglycan-associated lipoprotein
MKKFIFLLILPIFLGLVFSGCYYPTTLVYEPTEETFAPRPSAVSLEPIFFDFNKSNITPDAKAILDKNAEWISKNPTAKIQIVGNCDERASNEYNMDLGKRRANAAKQYLVNLGIAADRLSTVSRGKEKPLDPGHYENAWAENRRVDFNVAGELLGEQIKPRGEMGYDHPYPYPYYPWGYYDPWWGYPYWWGGLGFSYYYYPHSYYYGGYYSPWYGYYGGYYRGYHRGYHGGHHGGGSHGGGHRR